MMSSTKGYRRLGHEESLSGSSTWLWIWRGVNLIMTVFFCLAAYVNLNDPDPYIWVPIYSIPGLLSFALCIKPDVNASTWWKAASTLHGILCVVGACYLAATLFGIMKEVANPLEHEEGRELAGLIITAAWLGVCRLIDPGSGSAGASTNTLVLVTAILGLFPLVIWGLCFIDGINSKLGHCRDMFPDIGG